MKTKQLLVAAAVAMTTLFSCQKNETVADLTDDGEKMDVVLRIGGTDAQSRVIQDGVASGAEPNLNSGLIFFYNSVDGTVWKNDIIDAALIKSATGQTFSGISSKATDVYIIGNAPAALKTATKSLRTITAVKAELADRNTQDVAADAVLLANILKASMPGFDGVIKPNAVSGNNEAKVLLAPVVSRIQLADISTTDPLISDFEVKGVYIDNYHEGVAPTTDKAAMSDPLTVAQDGSKLGMLTSQPFDQATGTIAATGKKVTASDFGTGSVFAYHVAPSGTLTPSKDYVPAIIVKLVNVAYTDLNGNPATMDGYLTVTKYTDASGEIKNFAPGTVYNIPSDSFVFDLSDISQNPNQPDIELTVFAEVCAWTVTDVTPDL